MKNGPKCACEKPVLREVASAKGVSTSFCGRCKRPLTLRLSSLRPAA